MTHLRQTLRSAGDLVDAGLLLPEAEEMAERVGARYAIAITPAMAELIDTRESADPIARQFVPDARELVVAPEERADPIGDHAKSPVRGIVHRYRDRVLLKIVGVCPVYCRFCFRREMVGPAAEANLTAEETAAALAYIRAHPEIWEVILTGGDPLILNARRIADLTAALGAIPHVKIVRWHTRVPVVAPERVTADLVGALAASRATVYVALHANHPRELMRAFVEARVKPYYLHHGDLAPGTAHLRTTLAEGEALMRALRPRLSGLAMPLYVLDIPGGHGKVPVGPRYLEGDHVTDPNGGVHRVDGTCAFPAHGAPG